VLVISGSRVGGNIDRAEGQRFAASRASNVATDSAQEIKGVLERPRKAHAPMAKNETKACTDAGHRVMSCCVDERRHSFTLGTDRSR
jgi:hypothetical protein